MALVDVLTICPAYVGQVIKPLTTNNKGDIMKRLQVLKDGNWEYVFCYSAQTGQIITTKNRRKALKYYDYEFFCNKYGNDSFKVV